jgi:hypothetical protein
VVSPSPVYYYAGRTRDYTGAMRLDRKSNKTIIEDKLWLAKNQILSTMGSKPTYSHGCLSQRALLPVGAPVENTK